MLRNLLGILMAVAACSAFAAPQTFSNRAQTIRAGVVVLASDFRVGSFGGQPVSAAPHAFSMLDRATGTKPAGWTFDNPIAPSTVTSRIKSRWDAISGLNLSIGQRISKRNAPYWEVFLESISIEALSRFDVLLIAPRFRVSLNPIERERLRKFVDQGGILWVDTSSVLSGSASFGFDDPVNNLPMPFTLASLGSGQANDSNDLSHPLLQSPNLLSSTDFRWLSFDTQRLGMTPVDLRGAGGESVAPLLFPVVEDFFRFRPVSLDSQGGTTLATVAVGRLGDGFVVSTTRGVALKLNNPTGRDNTQYETLVGRMGAPSLAAARFAINLVSLRNEFRQVGGGTRKAGSNALDVTAPLIRRFSATGLAAREDANASQPAIWRGMIFVSSGSVVYCYDANPSSDLDGDGQPDDGARDYALGSSVDLLWRSESLAAQISAPVIAEVPESVRVGTPGIPEYQVLVTTITGQVVAVDAAPPARGVTTTTRPAAFRIDPPSPSSFPTGVPNPPTPHEGFAFVADAHGNRGRIWIADIRRGVRLTLDGQNWQFGGPTVEAPPFSSGPTIAYIPAADNSGAVDKVLYVPFQAPGAGSPTANTPGFLSIWVGTKGERPVGYEVDTGTLSIDTRAFQNGGLPIFSPTTAQARLFGSEGVRITLLRKVGGVATGDAWPASTLANVFTGSITNEDGQIRLPLNSGYDSNWFDNNVAGVRVDYTIDWGRANLRGNVNALERGRLNLPTADSSRRILGNLAVSKRGTLFAVIANPANLGNGGSLFGFREDVGRGAFRCILRYDLFDQHSFAINQGQLQQYDSNFRDLDALAQLPGISAFIGGNTVTDLVFRSGPTVLGDRLFVSAAGRKGSGFIRPEVGMVLCFNAEPELPTIQVGPDLTDNFSIVQPDLLRSTNRARPEIAGVLQQGNFRYDRETGIVRFDNLMNLFRGQIQNCLNLSQPVIVRRIGQGDTLVEPERAGGRWSPLQWYTVLHALQVRSAPVVAGNTLYVAGSSLLPAIVNGTLTGIPTPADFRGMVYGLNVQFGSNDRFLLANPDRPWIQQFVQLRTGTAAPLEGNPNFLWPSFANVTTGSLFAQRVNQSVLRSADGSFSTGAYGIVAGAGAAVAWGEAGFYAFGRADVIVADEGRIGRFDAAGNPIWVADATANIGQAADGTVGRVVRVVRPVRAYPIGASDYLVVDAGANRVIRIASDGTEIRSVDRIQLDPNPALRPRFLSGTPELTLKGPRDAVSWSEYVTRTATPVVSGQEPVEYWTSYAIADTGNRRIVWLVDRFRVDASGRILGPVVLDGVPQLGVLYWQSPAAVSGSTFSYTSLARLFIPADAARPGRYVFIAGVGEGTPTRATFGLDSAAGTRPAADGQGAIVVFDSLFADGYAVYNQLSMPNIAGTPLWNEETNSWDTNSSLHRRAATRQGGVDVRQQRIGSVRSVSARILGFSLGAGLVASVMFTDPNGVYEVSIPLAGSRADTLAVNWMLPREAYVTMRRRGPAGVPGRENPRSFLPTFARRLDSGEILIVNGYFGNTRGVKSVNGTFTGGTAFTGEIVQLEDRYQLGIVNFGFYAPDVISYELNALSGVRNITLPMFAERR